MRYAPKALAGLLALGFAGPVLAQGMMGMGMHGMMMGEGDQKVTKEEFLEHSEKRFARMDANKDGVIDATDRAAMRKRMHDCMGMTGGDAHGGAGSAEAHHPEP